VARWLTNHEAIGRVFYPGLETHSGYGLLKEHAVGYGAMLSFEVPSKSVAIKVLNSVRLISYAESLGGVESLITYPIVQTHAAIPQELLKKLGVNEMLLRLSVGIEAPEDIIEDLEQAMGG
jgi:cystathionine beta-lyase/cystathionine gamma-synthase